MEQFLNVVRTAFTAKAPGLLGCSKSSAPQRDWFVADAVHLPELLRLHATFDTQTIPAPR
jgi:hypothetical protein